MAGEKSEATTAFSFAVLGDTPYGEERVGQFNHLIDEVNATPSIEFVIHVGDIKGGEPCSDQLLASRLAQFRQFRPPLVFTPGDNEWTDCHRPRFGAYHPVERLEALRKLFFPNPGWTLGREPIRVDYQGSRPEFARFVENVAFEWRGSIVSTVHVVGSNNGLAPWGGIDADDSFDHPRTDRRKEVQRREAAAIQWLNHVFALAARKRARALVIAIHANPHFEKAIGDTPRIGFDAFLSRLSTLLNETAFPVLLVHGDHHRLIVDTPLPAIRDENRPFMRIQTYGPRDSGWIRVTVDPAAPGVFTAEPHPLGKP
jgi:hypothetical protein